MGYTLAFGSVASSAYSVEALNKPTMLGQAARDVSFVSVPGRNGSVAIDNGRWTEFTESYTIHGAIADVAAFRADLAALEGAEEELTDTFDTTHLRLGRFVGVFHVFFSVFQFGVVFLYLLFRLIYGGLLIGDLYS